MKKGLSDLTLEGAEDVFLNFAKQRGWEKKYFPNQIAKALVIEAAELLEIFQRKDDEESVQFLKKKGVKRKLAHEAVDVLFYLLMLVHVAGVNFPKAITGKLRILAKKYPSEERV